MTWWWASRVSYCAADAHHSIRYGRRDRLLQPSIYNRGLLLGETPNMDHLGKEVAIFMSY